MKKQKGMTLIEMMIAISISSIVILIANNLLVGNTKNQVFIESMNQASTTLRDIPRVLNSLQSTDHEVINSNGVRIITNKEVCGAVNPIIFRVDDRLMCDAALIAKGVEGFSVSGHPVLKIDIKLNNKDYQIFFSHNN
jgi:prepilin-type N-terminal cleavage/methylation domain-containing protein